MNHFFYLPRSLPHTNLRIVEAYYDTFSSVLAQLRYQNGFDPTIK